MKLSCLVLALVASTTVAAKTTSLLCETQATTIPGSARGSASKSNAQNSGPSRWNVLVESDQSGKVLNVKLDNTNQEFTQNDELLKFKTDFIKSLEVDTRNLKARTTITGYDTAEQGTCKIVSTSDAPSATASATAPKPAPVNVFSGEQRAMVVNEIQTTSAEGFKQYLSNVQATLLPFGGTILVKGGNGAATDGFKSVASVAVIQFPSRAKALQWYESAEYQKILRSASASATYRIFSVEE